ncbi:GNAT family N-acetyltransferase [Pedobacter nyackensis]|nr:GNAT family N-acetyltransferase [Pedobacter nyackensis]
MPEIITLRTDRLIITDLNYGDLDFIHVLHLNPEVQKYATLDIPESIDESKDYLRKYMEQQSCSPRKEYGFSISLVNQEPIGLIGLSNGLNKFKNAELWFKLHPGYWGKGYITEAALLLLKFGFERLLLHRIEAGVATENIASIRVLEKIGMQKEGIRRKILPIRGEWKDNFHYAVLEDDFIQIH